MPDIHIVFDKLSAPKYQKYMALLLHAWPYSDLTVPTTFEMPATAEHTKNAPATVDKNPRFKYQDVDRDVAIDL